MREPPDLFEFWQECPPDARIHPADQKVFDRVPNHGFEVENALPGCFMGPLQTAPVVLLFLSPGLDDGDRPNPELVEWHVRSRSGREPLVADHVHPPAHGWWTQRTKFLNRPAEECAEKIAILNIGAYHSKTFNDHGLLAALPSSRVVLDWSQQVLFPEAEAGRRVVICLRAARYWGLEAGMPRRGTLFAPAVTRGGHSHRSGREEMVSAAQMLMDRTKA